MHSNFVRVKCAIFFASFWSTVQPFTTTRPVQCDFKLTIIHFNDFHARFEPINYETDEICNSSDIKCVGGFSRMYKLIETLRTTRPNPIVLNAGDNYQGTVWYNFFKWNATLHFMNLLSLNASTLGNHDFDDGVEGIVPYLEGLNSPVLVSNIEDRFEPEIQGLYNKSTILTIGEQKVGVIGVIISRANKISRPGKLQFYEESASVNKEADRLVREENVDTIIVISHCGYNVDKEIAKNASKKIGLIVGGHSHSFLYTGNNPPGPNKPVGDYPTVIEHADGRKILVVQASSFTKYLGNLTVYYNQVGSVVGWDGAPIFIENELPQDDLINEDINAWKKSLEIYKNRIVGESSVLLDRNKCWSGECNIGSLLADAMVWAYQQLYPDVKVSSKYVPIGLLTAGGIRESLQKGNITYADLLTVNPYGNTLDYGYIEGKYIIDAITNSIGNQLIQFSGLQATYDFTNHKAYSIKVKCSICLSGYEDINPDQFYLIVIPSFYANGGDTFNEFPSHMRNHSVGPLDIDALESYVKQNSPITQNIDGRIKTVGQDLDSNKQWAANLDSSGSTLFGTKVLLKLVLFVVITTFCD